MYQHDDQSEYKPVGGKISVPDSVKRHGAIRRAARLVRKRDADALRKLAEGPR